MRLPFSLRASRALVMVALAVCLSLRSLPGSAQESDLARSIREHLAAGEFGLAQDLAASAAEEQNQHRLSFTEIPHPDNPDQTTRVVSTGHTSEPAAPKVQRPPPRLGEHTDEVLRELGYQQAELDEMRAAGVI